MSKVWIVSKACCGHDVLDSIWESEDQAQERLEAMDDSYFDVTEYKLGELGDFG